MADYQDKDLGKEKKYWIIKKEGNSIEKAKVKLLVGCEASIGGLRQIQY